MDKKNTDISNEKESNFCIEKTKKYKKRIKVMKIMDIVVMIGIIILIIIILLLRGCVGDNMINGTVNIPGNIINTVPPATATSIELTNKEGYDNIPFEIKKMLPGDSVSQYYCVTATHNSNIIIRFGVLLDLTQKLSSVMKIKVEELVPGNNVLLYDGLIKNCKDVDIELAENSNKKSEIYYRITVYTIGSEVGNEYVEESLEADFIWEMC